MKMRTIIPAIIALALSANGVTAQPVGKGAGLGPRHMSNTEQMEQRFQRMTTMMGNAKDARGTQRMDLMQQHMQLMQEQMQAMHSMMAGGMLSGRMGGGRMMAPGSASGGPDSSMYNHMQTRLDMMQQMMEQMLDQQSMMMQQKGK